MKKTTLPFLFLFLLASGSAAQITVTPGNVFTNSRMRFGHYQVINTGPQPLGIIINSVFGYLKRDESGNTSLVFSDSTKRAKKFSAASWVHTYPKRFILQPGRQQTVRLRIAAPADIPDRMYWARIIVNSKPLPRSVGEDNDPAGSTSSVAASIGIRIRYIIGLFYRQGKVSTGITIKSLRANVVDSTATLWVKAMVNRTGNAPFLGTIYATVYNEGGEKVAQSLVSTTIHFNGLIERPVDISGLPPGAYTAEIRFEAHRDDIDQVKLAPMPPATQTIAFEL